jgi:hypothetical protein
MDETQDLVENLGFGVDSIRMTLSGSEATVFGEYP